MTGLLQPARKLQPLLPLRIHRDRARHIALDIGRMQRIGEEACLMSVATSS